MSLFATHSSNFVYCHNRECRKWVYLFSKFKSSNCFYLLLFGFAGSSGDELDLSKDSNRSTSLVPPALQITPWSPPSYADRLKVIFTLTYIKLGLAEICINDRINQQQNNRLDRLNNCWPKWRGCSRRRKNWTSKMEPFTQKCSYIVATSSDHTPPNGPRNLWISNLHWRWVPQNCFTTNGKLRTCSCSKVQCAHKIDQRYVCVWMMQWRASTTSKRSKTFAARTKWISFLGPLPSSPFAARIDHLRNNPIDIYICAC